MTVNLGNCVAMQGAITRICGRYLVDVRVMEPLPAAAWLTVLRLKTKQPPFFQSSSSACSLSYEVLRSLILTILCIGMMYRQTHTWRCYRRSNPFTGRFSPGFWAFAIAICNDFPSQKNSTCPCFVALTHPVSVIKIVEPLGLGSGVIRNQEVEDVDVK